MIVFLSIIISTYAIMIIIFCVAFALRITSPSNNTSQQNNFSILIPFKNEENGLPGLLASLLKLKGTGNIELIFINDHSSDNSLKILQNWKNENKMINCTVLSGVNHGKKEALIQGVNYAKNSFILTTDADCQLPTNLLSNIELTEETLSIGTTLKTSNKPTFLSLFQEVESLIISGITIGSIHLNIPQLASGANLIYNKNIFSRVQPFQDNLTINSGDDMFTLEAYLKKGYNIKSRTKNWVSTGTEPTWESYLNQTSRWYGKMDSIHIPYSEFISKLTFLSSIVSLLCLVCYFIGLGDIFLKLFLLKFFVDFLFLFLTASFYKRWLAIPFAPIMAIGYPIYLMVLLYHLVFVKKKQLF